MFLDIGTIQPYIPPTGNSHNATNYKNKEEDGQKPEDKEKSEKEKDEKAYGRKEQSVLQAKLTRLAIQIGYGGL